MGFPKQIVRRANAILSQRRQEAERRGAQQKAELYTAIPRLGEIEQELSDCGRGVIAAVAAQSGNARAVVEQMKAKSLSLQAEREQLLREACVPPELLEPPYHCSLCHDQGYVGTHRCSCLEQLLRQLASQELGLSDSESYSFDNFSLDYYSPQPGENGQSPRSRMQNIKKACQDYASSFDPAQSPSLLFIGGTGLGKTHLSLAIGQQVIQGGHGVLYASVQNLAAKLEEERFSSSRWEEDSEPRSLSMVLETDLLILDDLGTEFSSQFVTTSLYNIINTRLQNRKPMILSTNLLPEELTRRYTDRLVSRLFGSCRLYTFVGKDIRIQKTLNK